MSKEAQKKAKLLDKHVIDAELMRFTHSLTYVASKLENRIPFESFTIEKLGLEKSEKGGPIDIGKNSATNLLDSANLGDMGTFGLMEDIKYNYCYKSLLMETKEWW